MPFDQLRPELALASTLDDPQLQRCDPRHYHEEVARKPVTRSSTLSQSEHDWAYAKRALARGDDPELVIQRIADCRAEDKADPNYYGRHTVAKAQDQLQREPQNRGTSEAPLSRHIDEGLHH
jgi:hypothetical protein